MIAPLNKIPLQSKGIYLILRKEFPTIATTLEDPIKYYNQPLHNLWEG
jgi:hypothetical protein